MSEKELIEGYIEENLKNISKENLERWNNKNNNEKELKEYFKSEYEVYKEKHCCKCKNKEEDCKIVKNTEGKCQCGEFKE